MEIRPATPSDIPAAMQVQRESLAGPHPYEYAQNINFPQSCVNLVGEQDGRVIGFVSILLFVSDSSGKYFWQRVAPYVAFIGVLEVHRKGGIGAQLLQAGILQTARRLGRASAIYLEHEEDNLDAHRFYERFGFKTLSQTEILELTGFENYAHPAMVLEVTQI